MIRKLRVALVLCLALTSVSVAWGWEVNLMGDFAWTYETYSQAGTAGFFGAYDRSTSPAAGDYATLNGWFGGLGIVSGSKAGQTTMTASFYPVIRITPALGLTGRYRLGAFLNATGGSYIIDTAPGVLIPIADGQWTQFSLFAQLPWGTLFYGKRPFSAGLGLQFDGTANRTLEHLTMTADYGPLRVGVGFNPYRDVSLVGAPFPVALPTPPANTSDNNRIADYDVLAFVTYYCGPLEFGVGANWTAFHQGPETQLLAATRIAYTTQDTEINEGWAYVKFCNGRLLFNAEADWYYRSNHFVGAAPTYAESWRWMAEAGVISGPTKATLFYAFMPGPDRRAGAFINRQTFVQNPEQAATTVFNQYSLLLGGNYQAGVNAVDFQGGGYINDATVLAARLDYAIAANLTLFGTVLTATRASKSGHTWGFIRPANTVLVLAGPIYADNAAAPAIPDDSLGWEYGVGISWNLLENWNLNIRGAYWAPGRWFNFACVDKQVAAWNVPTAGNDWGINPDRAIDSIYGMQISLTSAF